MKIKTILGLITCAGACASYSAFGNTTNEWFEATVGVSSVTTTNVNITATNGSAIAAFKYDSSMIVLDDDMESLRFTPIDSGANSDGLVTLTASAVLTPSDKADLEAVDGAKTGFAVGVDGSATNFYGYVAGGWLALSPAITTTIDASAKEFTLELNYRDGKVKFFVDGGYLTNGSSNEFFFANSGTTLANVDVWGNGKIGNVASSFEVAVAAYANGGVTNKYGSIAEAAAAAKAVNPSVDPSTVVQAVDSSGTAQPVNAKAQNGLSVVVCEALGLATDDAGANIEVAPVAADTDTTKITLAVNVAAAPEGSAVKYEVKKVDSEDPAQYYDEPSQIKIPLGDGEYTITPVLK